MGRDEDVLRSELVDACLQFGGLRESDLWDDVVALSFVVLSEIL